MKDPNWRKCVIKGDSRDYIKRIPDNSIDFILTDPPYNLSKHSTGNIPLPGRTAMNNDVADWDKIEFCPEEWAEDFIRILKPTGNLFIFTSYNQIGRWYDCLDKQFDTSNFMVWHKTNPAPKIFKAGFLNSCEMIFTCWNKRHTWNFISQTEMHNFIQSPICMRPERLSNPKHPTQKPVAILKKMIEIASNPDDIVFDPFMGVGSTGVAALELGRRFIGIELEDDYFRAAKQRIESTLKLHDPTQPMALYDTNETTQGKTSQAREEAVSYQTNPITYFFQPALHIKAPKPPTASGLQPLLKWPGGKEKELKYILPNLPTFKRFFEPFVGGGSVFMGIEAEEYFINDLASELIALYQSIAQTDERFFFYAEMIDSAWKKAATFFNANAHLVDTYKMYRAELLDNEQLSATIGAFCKDKQASILEIVGKKLSNYPNVLLKEMEQNLFRKMNRMRVLEREKHELPEKDLFDNLETAVKSAVYMYFRHFYNQKEWRELNPPLACALFFFIRNYAYSGMFRYSSKGDFNVPYGGIAYNGKLMEKKLNYYRSDALQAHFAHTHIYNLDFEAFLLETKPTEEDFIFLDPPYDSEFSTYAQNAFTREDQKRLADFLLYKTRAKWMIIIKNTEFIYDLYNREGIQIRTFEKEYLVSFMNRNDKKATHLLITNY